MKGKLTKTFKILIVVSIVMALLITGGAMALQVGKPSIQTENGLCIGYSGISTPNEGGDGPAPVSDSFAYKDTGGIAFKDTGGIAFKDY